MNKQLLLKIGGVVVSLLVVSLGAIYYLNLSDNDTGASSLESSSNETAVNDAVKWERHYQLHGSLAAHQFSSNDELYPEASQQGWDDFVRTMQAIQRANSPDLTEAEVNSIFMDPYTNTVYEFTQNNPDYGEIQYKFPASCDEAAEQFAPAVSSQSYAFRLKYSDGIRCSSSLWGPNFKTHRKGGL